MTSALNPPTFPIEIVNVGDYNEIPIAEILKNMFLEGIVENVNDPDKFSALMDAYSLLATLTVPVLKGGPGDTGDAAPSPQFERQYITDLDQIPTDLGDTTADLGRFYLYSDGSSTTIYVWTGALPQNGGTLGDVPGLARGWVQLPVGRPGPPGPYPILTPWLSTMTPGNGLGPLGADSWVATNDNGIQTVTITGTGTAGNLALIVKVNQTQQTTANIAYNNISAATIQSAIAALSIVGAGNVKVYDTNGASPYTVVFSGSVDVQSVSLMRVSSHPTGTTVTVAGGSAASPLEAWYLAVPPGQPGPASALGGFIDVDFQTNPPQAGDMFTCSDRVTPSAPSGLSAVATQTGGALTSATYYYKVTAGVPNGETVGSNEVSAVITSSAGQVALTWIPPAGGGTTVQRVYRGTAPGAENKLVAVILNGTTTSFTDVGGPTSTASPPATGIPANLPIWINQPQIPQNTLIYTMPRSAFNTALEISFGAGLSRVGTFPLPQQPFAWIPLVFAEVSVQSTALSLNPLLAQGQVTIGAPYGQLVASGSSNTWGTLTMGPDFGSNGVTPLSGVAVVPPNHTGNQGTLYVSLINQGLIDVFDFNAGDNAKLSVIVIPINNVLPVGVSVSTSVLAKMLPPGIGVGVGGVQFTSPLVRMNVPTVAIH